MTAARTGHNANSGGKSADAFRTIGEVATELNVPRHVLRFWESKFSQIRPMKRGGGRRYYRPEDIHLIRSIRTLLYDEGYTIKGAQRFLREAGPKAPLSSSSPSSKGADTDSNRQTPSNIDNQAADPQAAPGPSKAPQPLLGPRSDLKTHAPDLSGHTELQALLAELVAIRRLLDDPHS